MLPLRRRGSLFKYDPSVSFWNFLAVGNYAARFYRFAMKDVAALQKRLEEDVAAAVASAEKVAAAMLDAAVEPVPLAELLTALTNEQAVKISDAWRDLLPALITKYHDGYRAITDGSKPAVEMQRLFYPAWWLKAVGFFNSGINTGPGVIMFAPNPSAYTESSSALVATAALSSVLTFLVTCAFFVAVRKREQLKERDAAAAGAQEDVEVVFASPHSADGIAMGPLAASAQGLAAVQAALSRAQSGRRREYVAIDI